VHFLALHVPFLQQASPQSLQTHFPSFMQAAEPLRQHLHLQSFDVHCPSFPQVVLQSLQVQSLSIWHPLNCFWTQQAPFAYTIPAAEARVNTRANRVMSIFFMVFSLGLE